MLPCTALYRPQVDGQPVLRLNMYDLESGERSVFDQELEREFVGLFMLAVYVMILSHVSGERSVLIGAQP
jgi:hypothetical protein